VPSLRIARNRRGLHFPGMHFAFRTTSAAVCTREYKYTIFFKFISDRPHREVFRSTSFLSSFLDVLIECTIRGDDRVTFFFLNETRDTINAFPL
jgi:hypothetical protein